MTVIKRKTIEEYIKLYPNAKSSLHAWLAIHKSTTVEMLKHLMENHQHTQNDLNEVATQSVISEILSGKREMNLGHIRRLSEKYGVSPEVFI